MEAWSQAWNWLQLMVEKKAILKLKPENPALRVRASVAMKQQRLIQPSIHTSIHLSTNEKQSLFKCTGKLLGQKGSQCWFLVLLLTFQWLWVAPPNNCWEPSAICATAGDFHLWSGFPAGVRSVWWQEAKCYRMVNGWLLYSTTSWHFPRELALLFAY